MIGLQYQDAVEDLPGSQWSSPYHMEIHRNKEWTTPIAITTATTSDAASKAEVVFDETLHVRTWIDGGNFISKDDDSAN